MIDPQRNVSAEDRQRAFELLLRRRGIQASRVPEPPPGPAPRPGPDPELPLSSAQQRLWFIDQLAPGNPAYNVPSAFRFEGALDVGLLERALSEVVRRHEILRTTYRSTEGETFQVVARAGELRLPVIDLRSLPAEVREMEALHLAELEAVLPFDLIRGPVLRLSLLVLASEDHILLVTIHHIASDAWSSEILWREVTSLYRAWRCGRSSPLPELPLQYVDFAIWQRGRLTGELLETELAYWRRRLDGSPAVLELPTDRSRPSVQTFRGSSVTFELSAAACQGLLALTRQEGATSFMTLLALFQTLLRRYSGQTDVAVGTPITGRHWVELENLIGFFLNSLVLRVNMPGDRIFRSLLRQVRGTCLEAFTHQDLPFERLVDELQLQRSLSHSPLFQVLFVLLHTPPEPIDPEEPGPRVRPYRVRPSTAKFDLTLSFIETQGLFLGSIEYNTDLFDWTTIQRLSQHLCRLAEEIADQPDSVVSRLPLLTTAERHQLLAEWNDSDQSLLEEPVVPRLFERQARRTPEALAVVFAGRSMSYAALDRRANQLAHHLRSLGVGPEVRVGLSVDRSLDMALGVLAILNAGGSYVPIDPAYPRERRTFMLRDAEAPVLLTHRSLAGELSDESLRVVCMDSDREDLDRRSENAPKPRLCGDHLAYVIYTSGSTGQPKGVGLSHRALYNLIAWHLTALHGGARTLQFASLSFDASFHEMFACWASGGTLYIADRDTRRDIPALADFLVEQKIEKVIFPVVVLHELAEEYGRRGTLPPLREITTTGEQLQTTRAMADLFRRLPGCSFHNHYGPSESHVATAYTLEADPDRWSTHPSIGLPIANSQIHLLDVALAPVPLGVPGELYIGGACLARGYAGRPGLTAERFVPDPFGREPGARLYRTGDKVRRLADGNLDFLGRFDHQVKIRGFRIELEEIESVLAAHPAVRQTVVLTREWTPDDKRLVAYIVADPHAAAGSPSWRDFLKERLPDYMVPSHFALLDSLPLTANGKVDRQALPEPEGSRPDLATIYAAPRSPIEELLANIWSELLDQPRVGVHDDFFELGGHSLLATRVISRLRSALQVEIPLRDLFEEPTVAGLSRRIERAMRIGSGPAAPPITPVVRQPAMPLSFAQQRLWFIDQLEPGSPLYNISIALRAAGHLDAAIFAHTLGEIVRRHEVLRTTYASLDGQPVQIIQPPAPFLLPAIDLTALPADTREATLLELASQEARHPFDLAHGPLFRASLVRLGSREHGILVSMHHIVSDAWSMGILVQELNALYSAFLTGATSSLSELAIQYADFAWWQRQWLSGEVLQAELGYWRERLREAPAVLELPLDRPRPPILTAGGASRPLALSPEFSGRVHALSRRRGTTLFMTLLAAFDALLHRHTSQDDLVVGSPVANRNRSEIEPLIGFFVNTLALRVDLSGDPTFLELLARVREGVLQDSAHQEFPFESLVEELEPQRSLSWSPLFQVMFGLQTAKVGYIEIAGLAFEPLPPESGTAKFDLTFTFEDTSEGIRGELRYKRDLFDATTAGRMANHFEALLEEVVADPGRAVSTVPFLTPGERHQLLIDWNDTSHEEELSACIHELFDRQVERTPDAVALVAGDGLLTYRQLQVQADRLTGQLRDRGIGPEVPVAILMERCPAMLVSMVAVLKAGGAYVPLDPSLPQERLAFLLADTRPSLLLTAGSSPVPLSGDSPPQLRVGAPPERAILQGANAVACRPSPTLPENLACILHTSGSTGRPKGVMLHHRGLVNRILWAQRTYPIGPSDRILQKATFSFDFAIWECFAPLLAGATVVLARPGGQRDSAYLARTISEREITVVHFVPSMLRVFLQEGEVERCESLRMVFSGGEALSPDLQARFFSRLHVPLRNQYGPTEISIDTTDWVCQPGGETSNVPIGRPIANTRIHLLDRHLQTVPVGVAAEVCIGGCGVARGYLDRPDLTAERFLPDPWSPTPGNRLYRTGDLARFLPDGNLEVLGRIDFQVKVRGFRIEPGEIEAMLSLHPAVREAVVLVREPSPGEPRLVAYLAPCGDRPETSELRSFLQEKLPAYMVPSVFVFPETWPRTPSGKTDRRALGALDPAQAVAMEAGAPPRDEIELGLSRIWQEILDVPATGVKDDFFSLGGHSLLAVRLMARIERELGCKLPLTAIFENPTVEQLASLIRRQASLEALRRLPLVKIQPRGTAPPFFCVHPVGGNVFSYVELARHLGVEQPFYGLQSPDPLPGSGEGPASIEDMAACYLEAIREVHAGGPYLLGGWSMGGVVAFEMARQLRSAGQEVALVALLDAPQPPDENCPEDLDPAVLITGFARDLTGQELAVPFAELQRLDPDSQLHLVLKLAQFSGALPPNTDLSQLSKLFAFFRHNARALRWYRPGPYPGRVDWFRTAATVAANPAEGWRRLATGGMEIHLLPGDHYSLLKAPYVESLAELLRKWLQLGSRTYCLPGSVF